MAVAPPLVFKESAKRSTQGCRRGYSPNHHTCGICRKRRKDVQKPARARGRTRTIRVSRGGVLGYLGLPVTFTTLWALVAFFTGNPFCGFVLFALRFNVAVLAGLMILEDRNAFY